MAAHHRRIYEAHYGPIPKDSDGRTYEIHHIDGDHNNNEISNLKCVPIQEHYDIHYSQHDWAACLLLSVRMEISPTKRSELSRNCQLALLKNGTHHFLQRPDGTSQSSDMVLSGTHPFLGSEGAKRRNKKRVEQGTHNFLGEMNPNTEKLKKGIHHFQLDNPSTKRIKNGTHHFLHDHPNKVQVTCPHCGCCGGKINMNRYHFDKCKTKIL